VISVPAVPRGAGRYAITDAARGIFTVADLVERYGAIALRIVDHRP
jgi:hypothetical protein